MSEKSPLSISSLPLHVSVEDALYGQYRNFRNVLEERMQGSVPHLIFGDREFEAANMGIYHSTRMIVEKITSGRGDMQERRTAYDTFLWARYTAGVLLDASVEADAGTFAASYDHLCKEALVHHADWYLATTPRLNTLTGWAVPKIDRRGSSYLSARTVAGLTFRLVDMTEAEAARERYINSFAESLTEVDSPADLSGMWNDKNPSSEE